MDTHGTPVSVVYNPHKIRRYCSETVAVSQGFVSCAIDVWLGNFAGQVETVEEGKKRERDGYIQ